MTNGALVLTAPSLPYNYTARLGIGLDATIQGQVETVRDALGLAGIGLIRAGQALMAIKDKVPRGEFLPIIRAELGMSDRHAQNLMSIGRRFADRDANFCARLDYQSLRLLAAPSTPDAVIEAVEQLQIEPRADAILTAIRQAQGVAALDQSADTSRQSRPPALGQKGPAEAIVDMIWQLGRCGACEDDVIAALSSHLDERLKQLLPMVKRWGALLYHAAVALEAGE